MFNKIYKYLGSTRFTLLLISLLAVMFLAGLWIPQESLLNQQLSAQWEAKSPKVFAILRVLHFTTIYTSPIIIALWFLFFLNLSLVMWQRLPLIRRRIELPDPKRSDPENAPGFSFKKSYPLPAETSGSDVIGFLKKRGFAVSGDQQVFCAVRNRFAPIAFGLFHLSFFLILLGGLTSVYSKFYGVLELAQGEVFNGELERYKPLGMMPKIGSPPNVSFVIKSIRPEAKGNTPTALKVTLADGQGQLHNIDINRPYTTDSSTFVLKDVGPAPLFIVKDPTGKELDGAFVKLKVMNGSQDNFAMAGFDFHVHFYPDYAVNNGAAFSRTKEFNNPVFTVAVDRKQMPVGQGTLAPNGSLSFAGGYRLVIKEMPLWVRFSVIKEHGLPILYAGFAISSLALIWRLIFFRREIIGAVREQGGERRLLVAGKSEYYKSLAEDEFGELFDGMPEYLRQRPKADAG
ncbi:MAG: cytochrome c biogenesis protein ResB [Oryzomonas sp.]|uniref:cytochrome c biogenesis protein ResB n=1 Tax=Oryzomonas sp. TaxID=2855186 RepID=UPI00284C4CA4|nr:cytochrome c biogenesis protein ResB [Oryzomonas sp.]MDR3580999.1 cytochrome c biogenesis protein ResB [Oryzomonas sp.]